MEVSDEITQKAKSVGIARQIREFNSDQRKRALALSVRDAMNADPSMSATAAESKGRSSDGYGERMNQLKTELQNAEIIVSEYDALKVRFESLRSLLSLQKSIANNL